MNKKKWFSRRTLSNLIVVALGVVLYLTLSNFEAVASAVRGLLGVLFPFVLGIGIAYILNMPMVFLERRLFAGAKRKRLWSLLCVYIAFFVLLAVLGTLVVPQVWESVLSVLRQATHLPSYLNDFTAWLSDQFGLEAGTIQSMLGSYEELMQEIVTFLRTALPNLFNVIMGIGSGMVGLLTSLIASLYMLASKEKLLRQCKRVVYALLPKRRADELMRVAGLSNGVFSGFIGGKIIDSAIIGVICFVFMWGLNTLHGFTGWLVPMPFAPLISIIIGITNIIPFFGPFIGAIPSALILLLVNPWSALWFVVFIIVLQQFDGNYLGPKILGDSTGLPPLWVLISIVVGGGLFGFAGMLLGVPTAAVAYTLASDFVQHRLADKGLDDESGQLSLYDMEETPPPAEPPPQEPADEPPPG